MTDRYAQIRDALAMGPTPGPWVHDGDGVTADDEDVAVAMCCPSEVEAAFIAACDPDTIRELLAERDQLAAALEAAREDAERYRWLRKGANRGANDDIAVVRGLGAMDYGMSAVFYTYSDEIDGDDLDAAIDQARGKGVAE